MLMKEHYKKTRISNWFYNYPKTTAVLVFFLILFLLALLLKTRFSLINHNEKREMTNIISVVHQNFNNILRSSNSSALTLAMTINDEGKPENFEEISKKILKNNKTLDAVQLVPDGIISYVYPYEENKAALGYNILNSPDLNIKNQAVQAINSKSMFFAGPLEMKQGGIGIVGRLSVYKNNKFWGFSSVIIKLNHLLEQTGINSIDNSMYYFQLSGIDEQTGKEEFYLDGETNFHHLKYEKLKIEDSNWNLYLIMKPTGSLLDNFFVAFIIIFWITISALLALFVYTILKKPANLQKVLEFQSVMMKEKDKLFQDIFNKSPIGIAIVDSQTGKLLNVNNEFCKTLGYNEDRLLQLTFREITHPDDLIESIAINKKLSLGELNEYHIQKRYLDQFNNEIWINLYVSVLFKEQGLPKQSIAMVENITQKKRAEEELNASFKLLSEQNKRLLNFSYIVSHNLRSHTSNIELIAQLLESSESESEKEEMIQYLKRVSKSLDDTMTNLNEVVNIRTNINLKIETLSLNEEINNAIHILNGEIQKKNAIINNHISDSVVIDYNKAYLESIIFNFISNALRYSHPDRSPVVDLYYNEATKTLSIKDNGIGIDLEKHGDELFGMYKTFNHNPDAKGIGLFISKNQVDALGGNIKVESTLGKGATFYIQFKE
jgi:PAS domain S-box-containing protein